MNIKAIEVLSKMIIKSILNGTASIQKIEILLSKGAHINYHQRNDGCTPLMAAIITEKDDIAEHLLWQGPDPLIQNNSLQKASELIKKPSTLYLKLKDFELLFHCLNNDLESLKNCLCEGALIDFQGAGGYNALMIAVENSFFEIVNILLDSGASVTLLRHDNKCVFQLTRDPFLLNLLHKARQVDLGVVTHNALEVRTSKMHFFR